MTATAPLADDRIHFPATQNRTLVEQLICVTSWDVETAPYPVAAVHHHICDYDAFIQISTGIIFIALADFWIILRLEV
jgi:hypothetical protein